MRRRGTLTGWGWGLLLGGAVAAASPTLIDAYLYRAHCANAHSDWGRNRTSFCASALRDGLTTLGTTVIIVAVTVAVIGASTLGLIAWHRARAHRARPTRSAVMLLGCVAVYTVALACETGRVLSLGSGLDAAIGVAPLTAGVIFAAWMIATGIAMFVIAAVNQGRHASVSMAGGARG
ncbi:MULTISPECIES: hypothetical protein [unclassified Microbacterium]|uniref:hypothetical protein n=1 Tax=unclassified Microbacterium TaxID=2609290 RepID=UPI003016009C